MKPDLLVGVDFSGDVGRWRASSRRPSVWIATGHTNEKGLHCTGLCAVQQLPGTEHPFNRLSRFLANGFSSFAAIDAPFSVPFSIAKDAETVWKRVLDLATNGRPFAKGQALVEALAPQLAPRGAKIMRLTEKYWRDKGVNVRSTMWAGPRGGAPFAVACMTLLARHDGPVWPLRLSPKGCMLMRVFRPVSCVNGVNPIWVTTDPLAVLSLAAHRYWIGCKANVGFASAPTTDAYAFHRLTHWTRSSACMPPLSYAKDASR